MQGATGHVVRVCLAAAGLLAMGGICEGQALSAAEKQVIAAVDKYLREMGSTALADRIAAEVAKGRIRFGAVQDNDNAMTDITGTKVITLNRSLAASIAHPVHGYRNTVDLAATLAHETVHQDQSAWAWRGDYWRSMAGGGNLCEQHAWGAGFSHLKAWMARAKEKQAGATSARDRELWARRRREIASCLDVTINDYRARLAEFGQPALRDEDGFRYTLDVLAQEVKAALAAETVAASVGKYYGRASSGGTEVGTVSFEVANGRLRGTLTYNDRGVTGSLDILECALHSGAFAATAAGRMTVDGRSVPFTGMFGGRQAADGSFSGSYAVTSNPYEASSGGFLTSNLRADWKAKKER